MGILENISGPLAQQILQRGTGVVVASGLAAFLVLAVVLNVLNQLLFKNPNEPPVVFHWLPIIGSTVTYGMDPYRFFMENRAKVLAPLSVIGTNADRCLVWRLFHVHSTWEKDYSISGKKGQRFYPQWQAEGCQRGGNLYCFDNPSLRTGCGVRLPELEVDGTKEGERCQECAFRIVWRLISSS
jgi:sterol 14-demethylase